MSHLNRSTPEFISHVGQSCPVMLPASEMVLLLTHPLVSEC